MVSGKVSFNTNEQRKETPKKWKKDKDSHSNQGANEYPNQISWKSRSGHYVIADDTKGHETLTVGHRSGSQVQFRPDGGVHVTTHNGKYEIVFGEDRVVVSGARDITVKGDASMRVYGNNNVTVHGDYNLAVMGDFNVTSKNHNRLIRGNIDTIAKNETKKLEGSSSGTYLGGYARSAKEAVSVISRTSKSYFGAGEGISLQKADEESEGNITVRNRKGDSIHQIDDGKHATNVEKDNKKVYMVADAGKYSVKADDRVNVKTEKEMKVESNDDMGFESGKGMKLASASGGVRVETQGDLAMNTQQNYKLEVQQNMHQTAQGDAGFEGSSTHVGRSAGTTHVVGSTTHVEGQSALNLNGGSGVQFPGLSSQLSFNFGDLLQQVQMPDMSSSGAQPSRQEKEATSWTSRLA